MGGWSENPDVDRALDDLSKGMQRLLGGVIEAVQTVGNEHGRMETEADNSLTRIRFLETQDEALRKKISNLKKEIDKLNVDLAQARADTKAMWEEKERLRAAQNQKSDQWKAVNDDPLAQLLDPRVTKFLKLLKEFGK